MEGAVVGLAVGAGVGMSVGARVTGEGVGWAVMEESTIEKVTM